MSRRVTNCLILPRLIVVLIAAVASAGCDHRANEAVPKSALPSDAHAISVRVANIDEYRATLAKLRGKVVLVDFWATWCPSCVEQFPHTVELHRKYAERGLAVVSVSLDEPEAEPQVREFLGRQGRVSTISSARTAVESKRSRPSAFPEPYRATECTTARASCGMSLLSTPAPRGNSDPPTSMPPW